MSPTLSGGSTTLTQCDIDTVVAANHWKLVDGAPTPHQPHVNSVSCDGEPPPPDGGLTGTLDVNVAIEPLGPFVNRNLVHIFFTVNDDDGHAVEGAAVHVTIVTPNPKRDLAGDFTTDGDGVVHTHYKVNSKRDGTGDYHVHAEVTKDQASGECLEADPCHAHFKVN